jgi:hypothetical protein
MMPVCALSQHMSACAYLHAFNMWRSDASWLECLLMPLVPPFKGSDG